ncbi:MAG: hypothetical protein Kapaf2KO_07200 [Candidatus Kapaibacteriales bacterium]
MDNITIAIPENFYADNISKNVATNDEGEQIYKEPKLPKGVKIVRTTDDKCQKMLSTREADIALLTPLSFARLSDTSPLRIINKTCVAAEDYTGVASIYFKGGVSTVESIGSSKPHSYLAVLSNMLVSELYGIDTNVESSAKSKEDIFDDHDAAIITMAGQTDEEGLDLSEEWLQQYETPLPLYMWCVMADQTDPKLSEIIDQLTPKSLPTFTDIKSGEGTERKGRLHFLWHEVIEKAIDNTLELLFYRQLTKAIHSVKIYNPAQEGIEGVDTIAPIELPKGGLN